MSVDILARFKETQLFSNPETGMVPGYVPAKITTPSEGTRYGRTVDIDSLKKGQSLTTIVFEERFTIDGKPIDVSEALRCDSMGRQWLETVEERYEGIKTEITLEELPFTPLTYTIYDDDFFKNNLKCRALLKKLPEGARYVRLYPLIRDREGKMLSPVYFHPRRVTDTHGYTTDYTSEETEEVAAHSFAAPQSHGVLLGRINISDLTAIPHYNRYENDFKPDVFPLQHFVETVYPVNMRSAHRINPLAVEVQLV